MKYGNYKIEKELGRGGMGAVYKAYDVHLRRHVALKVVTDGSFERFEREYRALAQLQHPNIVAFYEYGTLPHPFFAMEYVEGETLEEKIAQKSIVHDQLIDIIIDICEGLQEAHSKGIFHRDIKPANIIIGNKNQAKVMDFGIARSNLDCEEKLSKTGHMIGTLLYMSPEQINGEFSAQTDIYSLGACIYEALTGRAPHEGKSRLKIMLAIQEQNPIRPCELNAEISPYLEAICLKCLAHSPKKRYRSMRQLARDLKNLKENKPIIAKRFTAFDQIKATVKSNKSLFAFIALVTCFLFTFSLYSIAKERKLRNINRELHVLDQAMSKFTQNILNSNHQSLFASTEITTPLYQAFEQSSYLKNAEEYLFLRGIVYGNRTSKQDKEQAMVDFTKLVNKRPHSGLIHRNIGVLHQQLGNQEQAQIYFKKACDLSPKDARNMYALATILFEAKQYTQAIKNFIRATEMQPLNAEYQYKLALAYNTLQKPQQAFDSFTKTIEIAPNFAVAYRERAILFFKFRLLDKAISDLKRAISLGLTNAATYCDLGSMYFEKKHYTKALENCMKAIEIDASYDRSYYTTGLIYQTMKKYSKAIEYYDKSIELNPKSISSYINRGNVYRNSENYSKAISDYNKVLSIQSYYLAHANLAEVLNIIGLFEQAIEQATIAIRLQNNYKEYYQRGLAYHKLRMYDKAMSDYNKAIDLCSPPSAAYKIYERRGDLYFTTNNQQQAIRDWQQVISLKPSKRQQMTKKIMQAKQNDK